MTDSNDFLRQQQLYSDAMKKLAEEPICGAETTFPQNGLVDYGKCYLPKNHKEKCFYT